MGEGGSVTGRNLVLTCRQQGLSRSHLDSVERDDLHDPYNLQDVLWSGKKISIEQNHGEQQNYFNSPAYFAAPTFCPQ